LKGDTTKVDASIEKFNARWPEAEIKQSELRAYVKRRGKG